MTGYEKFEIMLDEMGAEALLDELVQAMGDRELGENMEFIARMNDVELDEDEDEDE